MFLETKCFCKQGKVEDKISNPENVGSVFKTLLLLKACCDLLNR